MEKSVLEAALVFLSIFYQVLVSFLVCAYSVFKFISRKFGVNIKNVEDAGMADYFKCLVFWLISCALIVSALFLLFFLFTGFGR